MLKTKWWATALLCFSGVVLSPYIVTWRAGYMGNGGILFVAGMLKWASILFGMIMGTYILWREMSQWKSFSITKRCIYAMLVCGFIFLPIGSLLFGPEPATIFLHGVITRLNGEVNADRLRGWAREVLGNTNGQGPMVMIAATDVPKEIQNIEHYPVPRGYVESSPSLDKRYVSLRWGGGFFGWGMMIGDTNLTFETDDTCLIWKPGIFVFVR